MIQKLHQLVAKMYEGVGEARIILDELSSSEEDAKHLASISLILNDQELVVAELERELLHATPLMADSKHPRPISAPEGAKVGGGLRLVRVTEPRDSTLYFRGATAA